MLWCSTLLTTSICQPSWVGEWSVCLLYCFLKDNRFMRQDNNFARASHLICTFLCRLCTTTTRNCYLRSYLHGGRGAQVGEVACGVSPHLSCKRDQIKVRDYMDRRDTPPKAVTTPALGPPPPCKQALILFFMEDVNMWRRDPRNSTVRGIRKHCTW